MWAGSDPASPDPLRISGRAFSAHIFHEHPGKEDYLEALNTTASGGWIGAKIYDALLPRCASRCAVERIYTFHLGDFGQLAPAGLQEKKCAP